MSVKEAKKFTVADVYQETARLLQEEMGNLKSKELTDREKKKMEQFARALSVSVLKEMKVV